MWEGKKKGVIKASPYAECYSLSSLFLTMVAELKDTMTSKYFPPPALLKDKYSTWRKEMKIWELVTSLDIVNYAENNQMDPTGVYFGRSSYQHDSHFNNLQEKINHAGRRQGYKSKTRSTNKKKLNPQDRTGNITVCFNCGCRFHWSCDCPYGHSRRNKHGVEIEEDLSMSHVVLMSQQKRKNSRNIFLSETLGSAVLDCGASSTIRGTKWYKCFLETLTDAKKKNRKNKRSENL